MVFFLRNWLVKSFNAFLNNDIHDSSHHNVQIIDVLEIQKSKVFLIIRDRDYFVKGCISKNKNIFYKGMCINIKKYYIEYYLQEFYIYILDYIDLGCICDSFNETLDINTRFKKELESCLYKSIDYTAFVKNKNDDFECFVFKKQTKNEEKVDLCNSSNIFSESILVSSLDDNLHKDSFYKSLIKKPVEKNIVLEYDKPNLLDEMIITNYKQNTNVNSITSHCENFANKNTLIPSSLSSLGTFDENLSTDIEIQNSSSIEILSTLPNLSVLNDQQKNYKEINSKMHASSISSDLKYISQKKSKIEEIKKSSYQNRFFTKNIIEKKKTYNIYQHYLPQSTTESTNIKTKNLVLYKTNERRSRIFNYLDNFAKCYKLKDILLMAEFYCNNLYKKNFLIFLYKIVWNSILQGSVLPMNMTHKHLLNRKVFYKNTFLYVSNKKFTSRPYIKRRLMPDTILFNKKKNILQEKVKNKINVNYKIQRGVYDLSILKHADTITNLTNMFITKDIYKYTSKSKIKYFNITNKQTQQYNIKPIDEYLFLTNNDDLFFDINYNIFN